MHARSPTTGPYAQNFVLQDAMFESAASWSLPEHLFMVSGWSAACQSGDINPMHCVGSIGGQLPRPGPTVEPTNAWTGITYLLDKAHVSWRYLRGRRQ